MGNLLPAAALPRAVGGILWCSIGWPGVSFVYYPIRFLWGRD